MPSKGMHLRIKGNINLIQRYGFVAEAFDALDKDRVYPAACVVLRL
jgi:hypothetical protein